MHYYSLNNSLNLKFNLSELKSMNFDFNLKFAHHYDFITYYKILKRI